MKSASQMSQLIRAKKRKMMEDPDVIDTGGSPECDLQDLEIDRQNHSTEALDDNTPMEHDDGANMSNSSESAEETHEQPMHKDENANHQDNEKELLRRARLKKSMR